jgi:3'(2'), 5'-bisphosphate nucleotidase
MTDQDAIDLAAALARRAAASIMGIRDRGFSVSAKRDESPVTEADRAAEALITEALRDATPDIPVVAEEEVAANAAAAPAGIFWLVDPLDGTREFAAGRDDFTVNIGLVRDGTPVLGVVALPAHDELFGGIVGQGAWKQTGSGPRCPITARMPPAEGLTVIASRHYATDPKLAAFLRTMPVAQLSNVGSAVKFVRVAEGAADFYPRMGRTMEWDTAAPQAVLEAAGGSVRLMEGGSLRYGKPDWVNPPFLCRGR